MKNLHVLPTDHPSRLRYNIKTRIWELNEFHKYHTDIKSTHNIYITSEEEIKEGDWYLDTSMKSYNFAVNKCDSERLETVAKQFKNLFKKIILTTDQKLIVGNVQPISGEFLQQFIKNSNCEFVETERLENGRYVNFLPNGGTEEGVYENYKIIIPSEESKQGRTCTNNCSVVCGVKNENLKLSDRVWTCNSCGTENSRDHLASQNILKEGRKSLGELALAKSEA